VSDEQFFKRLTRAREQAGLSQSQAARLAGVEKDTMKWAMTGENPHFDRQAALDRFRAKGVSFDDATRLADLLESLRREGE
jgi:transcriptional regulator with XRE-family HTH domain